MEKTAKVELHIVSFFKEDEVEPKCSTHVEVFLLLFGLWGCWHCGHSWPIVPAPGDNEDDCGEADGM
jgi:hypothetical protein